MILIRGKRREWGIEENDRTESVHKNISSFQAEISDTLA